MLIQPKRRLIFWELNNSWIINQFGNDFSSYKNSTVDLKKLNSMIKTHKWLTKISNNKKQSGNIPQSGDTKKQNIQNQFLKECTKQLKLLFNKRTSNLFIQTDYIKNNK